MRRIAHLSDLHFGRTDARVVERLQAELARRPPDLLVVSGDLTQRARTSEFVAARAFLDAIPAPRIVVPGNHDIPLYNIYGRFVGKLSKYKEYICRDVEPSYSDPELLVVSVNTARSLAFKEGRINLRQLGAIRERLASAHAGAIRILVAHHPLDLPATSGRALAGRAKMAFKMLADCGIDLILSGHLHTCDFSAPADRLRIGDHTALLVQAGTAVSTRSRGETNSYNWIETAPSTIRIEQRCWSDETCGFSRCRAERYECAGGAWVRVPD